MGNNLEKHILNTLVYYDVMDYPMTVFEIWKHLLILGENNQDKKQYSLEDVEEIVEELVKEKRLLDSFQGLFFLRGRKKLLEERRMKEKISSQKLKRAFRLAQWFKLVPFVEFVGVVGRVGMKNAQDKSDVDVLVILKRNRIFLGRFLFTGLVQVLGKRRHGKKIKNRICLNHFLVSGSQPRIKDLFACHEYSFLVPIFCSGEDEFSLEETFSWIREYKPNYFLTKNSSREVFDNKLSILWKKICLFFLDYQVLENWMEKWQRRKIKKNPKTENSAGIILVSKEELAFWPEFNNQGPKIWDKFTQNQSSVLD